MRYFLLLLFPFLLMADDTFNIADNTFTMFVNGDITPYYNVFQSVAMVVNSGAFQSVAALGAAIVMYFMGKSAFDGDMKSIMIRLAWIMGGVTLLLLPVSTIIIKDKRVDNGVIVYNQDFYSHYGSDKVTGVAVVDHVPIFLAAAASASSILIDDVTSLIDSAMKPVDKPDYDVITYSTIGYGTSYKDLMSFGGAFDLFSIINSQSADNNVSNVATLTVGYIQKCLVDKGLLASPTSIKYLINPSEDYISALNYENFTLSGDETVTINNKEYNCSNLYESLENNSTEVSDYLTELFKNMKHKYNMTDSSFDTYMKALWDNIIDPQTISAIGNYKQATINVAIANSIPTILKNYTTGVSGLQLTQDIAISKSKMNLINEGLGQFKWMVDMVPKAMNILFAFLLALYVPMALVALIMGDKGMKIVLNYIFGLFAYKSIDIGLAVSQNIVNYYGGMKIAEQLYSNGANFATVAKLPLFMSDAAMMSGLAGILGMAAVFITPTVVFYGESKAAIGLTGMVKGFFGGANPDSAADLLAKHKSNLDYEEEMSEMDDGKGSVPYYLKRLGVNSAEAAKYQAQVENEINAINRGAAFAASMAQGQTGDYAMGSFANSYSAVEKTVGAGVAVSTMNGGDVNSNIQSLANGSIAMGAKSIASTIGYGEEVELNAAIRTGEVQGISSAAHDNFYGTHMSKADGRVLGESQAISEYSKAEGLLKATDDKGKHIFNKDGHLENKDYIKGLEKETMQQTSKVTGLGSKGTMEDASKAGYYEGVKAAGALEGERNAVEKDKNGLNDLYKGGEREARAAFNKTIGTGEAVLTDKNGNPISEEKYMGFVKANAAKGFLAQGLAGEADLEKMHMDKDGKKTLDKDLAKGLYRSEAANLENIASMAHLGVSDSEFKKNILESGIEKGKMAQSHAKEMRNEYGDTLSEKEFKGKTFDERAKENAQAEVRQQAGKIDGTSKHMSELYKNAKYGSDAQQNSIEGEIQALGNGDENIAAQVKGSMANIKATEDKASIVSKLAEALKKTGQYSHLSPEQLKNMAEQMINNNVTGMPSAAGALSEIANKADALTGRKERSEYASIGTYASTEDFKQAGALGAVKQESKNLSDYLLANNPEARNHVLQSELSMAKKMGDKFYKNYVSDALKYGFAKYDDNGNLVASGGEEWVKGRELAKSNKMERMVIGGMRMETAYNPLTGEALVNADASINGTMGANFNANIGKPQNMQQADAKQTTNLLTNPKELLSVFAGKSYDWVKKHLEELGYSEESASTIAAIATAGGTGVVAATGTEALHTAINYARGKRVLKRDFSFVDAEGNEHTWHAGKEFSLNDVPEQYREMVASKEYSKVEPGIVRKFMSKTWDKLDKVGDSLKSRFFSSENQSMEETSDTSNTTQNQHTDKSGEYKTQHNSTPSNVSSSINENEENVNASALTDEEKFKQNLFQSRVDELKEKVASKKPRKPERIKLQQELLEELDNGKVDIDKLREFGFTKKELVNDFGDFMEDGKVVSPIGEIGEGVTKASKASRFIEGIKSFGGKTLDILDKFNPVGDALFAADVLNMVGTASQSHNAGIPDDLIKNGVIGAGTGLKVTPELLKQGDEQYRSMFPQFAGRDGIGLFHQEYNNFIKENNVDLNKESVYAQYTGEGIKFHTVPKSVEAEQERINKRIQETGIMTGTPEGFRSDIPNISTIPNMANPDTGYISTVTANAVNSPLTQHDVMQSVNSQIQALSIQQSIAQNLDGIKQFANPVAPVPGVTMQTAAGEIGIGTSANGNLQIGGYETHIPVQEFRQAMQDPNMQQQFVNTVSQLPLNNDNFADFGAGYKKNDNGTVETLLQTMNSYTRQQTKDSVVGFSAMMDYAEYQADVLTEMKENIEELNEITKIRGGK